MNVSTCLIVAAFAAALLPAGAPAQSPAQASPAALEVAARVELGPISAKSWDNAIRWSQLAVTREGYLVLFYCTDKRKIVYQLSKDGRTFAQPAEVASGFAPAVTIDEDDNIYLVFKHPSKRIGLKVLKRTGDGQWDVGGEVTRPFVEFGKGRAGFPSVLILPGSKRIWAMANYQPADIFSMPKSEPYARRKPRGHAVVSYSDDGGATWADPQYASSDSGDEGSGVAVLRPWRGHPTWFWTFWDCATPAWGFFDGSRQRGLREFFPHKHARMAVGHPWDTIEDNRGGLYFASGIKGGRSGQLYKYFDGSKWSEEVFLADHGGPISLVGDAKHVFAVAVEGPQLAVYELNRAQAARRPVIYKSPQGKAIFRPIGLVGRRRPKGYLPLFLSEGTATRKGRRTVITDQRIVFLRLEVKPLDAKAAAELAAQPLVDVAKAGKFYKPMPLADDRIEPRTDVSKDRKIIRLADKWVIVYAEDNPGRLLAAEIKAGRIGEPTALTESPQWNAYRTSAAAGADGTFRVACEPHVPRRLGGTGVVARLATNLSWSTMCRLGKGFVWVWANGGAVFPSFSEDARDLTPKLPPAMHAGVENARPALLAVGDKAMMLVGGDDGITSLEGDGENWTKPEMIVKEKWIGHHFSAVADGGIVDVIYTPGASYLGKRVIGHVRREGGKWKKLPAVDSGHVIRGLSLCSLGGGKLLAVYCVRNDRLAMADVPAGDDRLKRFTYTLYRRNFDGKAWSAPARIDWPAVPVHRPAQWKDWQDVGGIVYIPEVDLGRFPTLPASAHGLKRVPVAWMVPGFHCLPKKERSPIDRGGLLVTTEIDVE